MKTCLNFAVTFINWLAMWENHDKVRLVLDREVPNTSLKEQIGEGTDKGEINILPCARQKHATIILGFHAFTGSDSSGKFAG